MKRHNIASASSAFVASVLLGTLSISSAYAQGVAADLDAAARAACTQSAVSKGFQVKEIVSVEPKAGTTDGANVVLNLDRAGQEYKLTCGYSKTAGAAIGDESPAASTIATPPVDLGKLWWLLLPLIGLPLLLLWTKSRDTAVGHTYNERSEAVVRNNGRSLNIYREPNANQTVTGTLYDGQRVTLSGRHNNDWTELADGGWVPTQSLETVRRYVTQ